MGPLAAELFGRRQSSAIPSGSRIGRLRIEERLARGRSSEVYRARDEARRRNCAVETLPGTLDDPERTANWEREARRLASVDHAGLAEVFAIEELGGRPLLVRDLVQGTTLEPLLRGRAISRERAAELLEELCAALQAAHAAGVVHGRLAPSRVMITPSGQLKVIGFGLAQPRTVSRVNWPYTAPELAQGPPRAATADVYAIGVLAYRMWTGTLPFRPATGAARERAERREVPRPLGAVNPRVPEGTCRVVMRCLRPEPGDRYADAGALGAALRKSRHVARSEAPETAR